MTARTTLFLSLILLSATTFSQSSILPLLLKIEGITVLQKEHPEFKEYYEIMVEQQLDHFNPGKRVFRQKVLIGYNGANAPMVMETEGYAIGKAVRPSYLPNCNLMVVEHRYFGKSLPDTLIWDYLTIKQQCYDLHHIRTVFTGLFKGKWMTTGISKGGQTAIAYKMYFPNDADVTLAHVTPVKKSQNDPRLTAYLNSLSKTEKGKKVYAFQKFALINKNRLLPEFKSYLLSKNYACTKMDPETIFEYALLEYPFAFFQNCFNDSLIPDQTTASHEEIIKELVSVVPVKFFTDNFRPKLEPSFYMFYHELGYYEYDLTGLKQWLSQTSYPNHFFAPQAINIRFDQSYLDSLNAFISDTTDKAILFIYGENDPYTSAAPVISEKNGCHVFIVKNGCHQSRITDLSTDQKKKVSYVLSRYLKSPITL